MSEIKSIFSANVKRLRKSLGIKQQELAEKLGVTRSYVALIETGRAGFTSESIATIAEALKTTPQHLFTSEKIDSTGSLRKILEMQSQQMVLLASENKKLFEDNKFLESEVARLKRKIEFGIRRSEFTKRKK